MTKFGALEKNVLKNLKNKKIAVKMNEITEEVIIDFLIKNKLEFIATHNKLSISIINRIFKKMKYGVKFEAIKINGDLIIDGHHRFISSKIAKIEIGTMNYPKSSATISYPWNTVKFVNEEWDTKDKIQYLNELDAEYNDIPLNKMIDISK